jgi:hypothetical protein
MNPWHDQRMPRKERARVEEPDANVVLDDEVGRGLPGDDGAEDAASHTRALTSAPPAMYHQQSQAIVSLRERAAH